MTIDKRIIGIMDGKFRKKYDEIALLAALLGEVKESLGEVNAKYLIIDKYLKKYSGRTAFKGVLKGFNC